MNLLSSLHNFSFVFIVHVTWLLAFGCRKNLAVRGRGAELSEHSIFLMIAYYVTFQEFQIHWASGAASFAFNSLFWRTIILGDSHRQLILWVVRMIRLFVIDSGSKLWLFFFTGCNFTFHRRPILLRRKFIASFEFAFCPLELPSLCVQMLVFFDISQCFQCLLASLTLKSFFRDRHRWPTGTRCIVFKLPFESFSKCHCWRTPISVRMTKCICVTKPRVFVIRSRRRAMNPTLCLSHLILVERLGCVLLVSQYPFSHH